MVYDVFCGSAGSVVMSDKTITLMMSSGSSLLDLGNKKNCNGKLALQTGSMHFEAHGNLPAREG